MKLEVTQDLEKREQIYVLTIPYDEWIRAKFHDFDGALFAECDSSNKVSDKLLGMETLARRIEEVI